MASSQRLDFQATIPQYKIFAHMTDANAMQLQYEHFKSFGGKKQLKQTETNNGTLSAEKSF